jgi:hypothetical protein
LVALVLLLVLLVLVVVVVVVVVLLLLPPPPPPAARDQSASVCAQIHDPALAHSHVSMLPDGPTPCHS